MNKSLIVDQERVVRLTVLATNYRSSIVYRPGERGKDRGPRAATWIALVLVAMTLVTAHLALRKTIAKVVVEHLKAQEPRAIRTRVRNLQPVLVAWETIARLKQNRIALTSVEYIAGTTRFATRILALLVFVEGS